MQAGWTLTFSRTLRRLVVWCLLVALPLAGWASTLAELLGPLHFHRPAALDERGPMAGWHDFRRFDGSGDIAPHGSASAHTHTLLGWHRHAAADSTVVGVGVDGQHAALDDGDGAAPTVPFAFVPMSTPDVLAVSTAQRPANGVGPRVAAIRSCDARRIERPPDA